MSRTLMFRLFGVFTALLLLQSSSADALGLHRCAHHDALPGAASDGHAHHHGEQSEPADKDAGCTCVGTCSLSTAGVVVVATGGFAVAEAIRAHAPARAAQAVLPASLPFVLPYSTAPPSAF